jgi:hypothetical protein
MLKNSQVTPALRAPGTLPARNSGSKSTVVGEMVTIRAANRPKIALIRRMIQPYLMLALPPRGRYVLAPSFEPSPTRNCASWDKPAHPPIACSPEECAEETV